MAKDTVSTSNKATIGLIVVALLTLGGIIYYSWSTKPADNNTKTTTKSEDTTVADVDKLGAREIALTPENFDEVTTKNKMVVVDMYSPTCSHCQKIAPILTELSDEYGDKIVVGKMSVAVDANRDFILSWDKNFQYVPAVSFYKDGQKMETITGERTKAEFKTFIDKYLN